ncbi:Tumor necrosis factor receptor superfamily member 8 [Varanus komodoensis]|nr:Tumor necrosis factor receptor superfamily member 8 [Varanus komodoensis]
MAKDSAGEGKPLREASADDGRPPEVEGAPSPEPDGAELAQVAASLPPEPPPPGHGNNHIEKVYIMKAETVIVGSVLEAPSGKSCPTRDEDGGSVSGEGAKETEPAMRYPEQETERCPGSDFTTPVEEEWEFHLSGEKTLAI